MKLTSQTTRSIGSGITARVRSTDVDALQHDDARIDPQLPGELTAPNIDGVDARRIQQHYDTTAESGNVSTRGFCPICGSPNLFKTTRVRRLPTVVSARNSLSRA